MSLVLPALSPAIDNLAQMGNCTTLVGGASEADQRSDISSGRAIMLRSMISA
jgi:hypothetical protein